MLQISKNLTRMRTTKRERESEFDIEDEDNYGNMEDESFDHIFDAVSAEHKTHCM